MARALDSILSELNNVYNPQRDVIRQQQEAIDPALQAEEKGLNFAKNDAFQQITDQANRRGLFYSGIPVAEEQKYTGGTFLPALANLRSKYQQQRFNLSDALNKIQADQYNQAYGIYQKEVAADEEARRWNEQMAAERAARASGGGGGGASPSFGGGVLGQSTGAAGGPAVDPALQALYNRMFFKPGGGTWGDQDLINDYNATWKSAGYGNAADKKKLELYHAARPDLFGASPQAFKAPAPAQAPAKKGNSIVGSLKSALTSLPVLARR